MYIYPQKTSFRKDYAKNQGCSAFCLTVSVMRFPQKTHLSTELKENGLLYRIRKTEDVHGSNMENLRVGAQTFSDHAAIYSLRR